MLLGSWNWSSCLRPSGCDTEWWPLDPPGQGRPSVSTCWWRPWQTVENPTKRWGWTPRPSPLPRCLGVWMWPPTTGRTGSSLLCGGELTKPRRSVCVIGDRRVVFLVFSFFFWGGGHPYPRWIVTIVFVHWHDETVNSIRFYPITTWVRRYIIINAASNGVWVCFCSKKN